MKEFKDSDAPKVRGDSPALPSFKSIHSTSASSALSQDSSASSSSSVDSFDHVSSIPTVDLSQVRKTAQELKNNPSFTNSSDPLFWNNQPFEQSPEDQETKKNNFSEEDLRSLEIPTWAVKNGENDSHSKKSSQKAPEKSYSEGSDSSENTKIRGKKRRSKKGKEKKIENAPLILGSESLDVDGSRSSRLDSDSNESRDRSIPYAKGLSKNTSEVYDDDNVHSNKRKPLLEKLLSKKKSSSKEPKKEESQDRESQNKKAQPPTDLPPIPRQAQEHTSMDGLEIPFPSDISVTSLPKNLPFASHVEGASSSSEDRTNIPLPAKHRYSYETVMRLIVAPIIAFIALIVALFAVLTATIWKPNPRLTAKMQASTQYVATDLGVLSLFGKSKNVDIKASSQHNVCLAVGLGENVTGWIGDAKYTRIEGLSNWRSLQVNEARNTGFSAPSTNLPPILFQNSDLWSQVKCGTDVDLSLKPAENESIIVDVHPKISANKPVDSAEQTAPANIQLTWPDINPPNQSIPLGVTAILLFICATLCATILSTAPVRKRIPSRRQLIESIRRLNRLQEEDNPSIHGVSQEAPRWVKDHVVRVKKETTRLRRRSPLSHKSGTSESLWDVLKKGKRGTKTSEDSPQKDSSVPPIPGSGTTGRSFPAIRDVSAVNITRQQEKLNPATEASIEHTSEAMAYQEVAAVIEEIKASAEKEDLENGEILDYSPEEVTGFFSRLSLELPSVDGSEDEPPYFSSSVPSPFNPTIPSTPPILHGTEGNTPNNLDAVTYTTDSMTGSMVDTFNPFSRNGVVDSTDTSNSSEEPPFSGTSSAGVYPLTSSSEPLSDRQQTHTGSVPTRVNADGSTEFSIYDPFDSFSIIDGQNSQLSDYLLDSIIYKNLESEKSENSTGEASHNEVSHNKSSHNEEGRRSRSKRAKRNNRSKHSH